MALSDSNRLYDLAVRKSIYIEGVKSWMMIEFNQVMAELDKELSRLIGRIRYKTLDAMTKKELNSLIIAVRKSQSQIYSKYANDVLKTLMDFATADLTVTKRVFATAKVEEDDDRNIDPVTEDEAEIYFDGVQERETNNTLFGFAAIFGAAKLWAVIANTPIAANGIYVVPFLKSFSLSAQSAVENAVRKAYANGESPQQLLAELLTRSVGGTASVLQRAQNQNNAVIDTLVSHVAGVTNAAVLSALYREYIWCSVIDSATTDICRGRNLHVYRFGSGPIPPAHIRCRSTIVPIGAGRPEPETFFAWLKRQPSIIQNEALGGSIANALRKGELKAKDLPKFENAKPISVSKYSEMVPNITTR